jgi:hypothetical protein
MPSRYFYDRQQVLGSDYHTTHKPHLPTSVRVDVAVISWTASSHGTLQFSLALIRLFVCLITGLMDGNTAGSLALTNGCLESQVQLVLDRNFRLLGSEEVSRL